VRCARRSCPPGRRRSASQFDSQRSEAHNTDRNSELASLFFRRGFACGGTRSRGNTAGAGGRLRSTLQESPTLTMSTPRSANCPDCPEPIGRYEPIVALDPEEGARLTSLAREPEPGFEVLHLHCFRARQPPEMRV
jgi:hypothetical protein